MHIVPLAVLLGTMRRVPLMHYNRWIVTRLHFVYVCENSDKGLGLGLQCGYISENKVQVYDVAQ